MTVHGWVKALSIHGPALLWTGASAWFLASPVGSTYGPPGLELILPPVDLLGHAALFAVGAAAVSRSARHWHDVRRPVWTAAGWVAGYGVLLEAVQVAVPGRTPQVGDVLANAAGALAYAAAWWALPLRRPRRATGAPAAEPAVAPIPDPPVPPASGRP